MRTTPRSNVRIGSYIAGLGWILLFCAAHRPDYGHSLTYAHAGVSVGAAGTALTVAATFWAVTFCELADAVYALVWLAGLVGAVFFVWVAFVLASIDFSGLLSLGSFPDPREEAVGYYVAFAGWIGVAATGLASLALLATLWRHRAGRASSA